MPNAGRNQSDKIKNLKRAAVNCQPIAAFLKQKCVKNNSVEVESVEHLEIPQTNDCYQEKEKELLAEDTSNGNNGEHIEISSEPTVTQSASDAVLKTSFYRGFPLDKDQLVKRLTWIEVTRPHKKREHGHCRICSNFIHEALAKSGNGRLPIGIKPGIELRFLERFIDHTFSESHQVAKDCSLFEDFLSETNANIHLWKRSLRKIHRQTRETLIHMAVSAYNDMRIGTLSGHSWPSRHLSFLHSSQQVARMHRNENTGFDRFKATDQQLHYVSPESYAEMCEFIGIHEKERLQKLLQDCTSIGLQIDGSQDRMTLDIKYVIARLYVGHEFKTVFLGICEPKEKGAAGLLEAIKSVLEGIDFSLKKLKHKLTSITTDGKAANTGEYNGLWALIQKEVGKSLITVWCSCHRADLVLGKKKSIVPEIKWWRSELLNIASYFRGAKARWKELRAIAVSIDQTLLVDDSDSESSDCDETVQRLVESPSVNSSHFEGKLHRFPSYFEVRMAKHMFRLVKTFLGNLKYCKVYFEKHSKQGPAKEKAEAGGYLKKLQDNYFIHFTCVVADMLAIFKILQKSLQSEKLLITDVKQLRDKALKKIQNMKQLPYPTGSEEEYLKMMGFPNTVASSKFPGYVDARRSTNKFVPFKRCFEAVRSEIIFSAENFLESQLQEDKILKQLDSIGAAKTAEDLMVSAQPFYNEYNITTRAELYDEVCGLELSNELPLKGNFDFCLKNSEKYPAFVSIAQALHCASPHSMVVERVVSMYNKIKSPGRCSFTISAIYNFLLVCVNGVGTAFFDPLPVIAKFLEAKNRRNKLPNVTKYEETRKYVQKFYQT